MTDTSTCAAVQEPIGCPAIMARRLRYKLRHLVVMTACATLAGCGGTSERAATRRPIERPHVTLTGAERAAWSPAEPLRSAVPVIVYHGIAPDRAFRDADDADLAVDPQRFARHMLLLHHAGYRTITLGQLLAFLEGKPVRLPARAFVLTFDDGRADSWTGSDAMLRELGFHAVMFIDVGRIGVDPEYLTWDELASLQRSGRWDVQLESGTGKKIIKWGPRPNDVGAFYTHRGADEVLGGWRERVFGDLGWAERQLRARVPGYRPLAVAPPWGNYGQIAANDPKIPGLLLNRLLDAFSLVFTQGPHALATTESAQTRTIGRLQVTNRRGDRSLRSLFLPARKP